MKTLAQIAIVLALTLVVVPAALACGGQARSAMAASNDATPAVEAPQATTTDAEATALDCSADCASEQPQEATDAESDAVMIDAASPEATAPACPYMQEVDRAEPRS